MYPNNNNNNNNNSKKDKNQKRKASRRMDRVRCERVTRFFIYFFSSFLSHIYENRTIDFCRSRMQSWYTRRGLRVGANILAFRQTSRGRKISHLCYFEPKGYVMAWNFLRGRERP